MYAAYVHSLLLELEIRVMAVFTHARRIDATLRESQGSFSRKYR